MPLIHSLTPGSTLVFEEAPRDIVRRKGGLVQVLANHIGLSSTAKSTFVQFLHWQRLSP
jgi:hypothetical protein